MLNFLQSAGEGDKVSIFLFIPPACGESSSRLILQRRIKVGIQKSKLDAPGLLIAGAGLSVIPDLIRDRHDI
jgi:hypothetical protein